MNCVTRFFCNPAALLCRTLPLAALLAAACTVGPDYHKPAVVIPPDWGLKLAEPADEKIKDNWWELFDDPTLNQLQAQAAESNRQLRVAVARVDQSRAVARITVSRFFPEISFDPSVMSFHTQKNHIPSNLTATAVTVPFDLSYEIDFWGKIRRSFESAQAQAESNVANYYQALLTLHGDVAVNYFLLRAFDEQILLSEKTLGLREKTVQIVTERFRAGTSPELDVQRASTEFFQTQSLLFELRRQRANIQDALAILCGEAAPSFQVASGVLPRKLPKAPVGLPSRLLERRPDVAEAERKMAAANAQIGVAEAAFFPTVSLTGNLGDSSFHTGTLFNYSSRLFQIGPAVTLPLLNGGRIVAANQEANAVYHAAYATYQQQVLVAFKDVVDALVDVDSYEQQNRSESQAALFAHRAAESSNERYKQGLVSYLDVIEAQRTELQTQLHATQISASRLISTVRLFKSLGGGFGP